MDFAALDKAEVLEVVFHVLIALYTGHAHGYELSIRKEEAAVVEVQ